MHGETMKYLIKLFTLHSVAQFLLHSRVDTVNKTKYNTVFLFIYLFLIWPWGRLVVITRKVELDCHNRMGSTLGHLLYCSLRCITVVGRCSLRTVW